MDHAELIACHDCDTLHRKLPLGAHSVAHCTRCGAELYRRGAGSVDRILAIVLAALITYFIAQSFPIVELETNGITTVATLIGAISILWQEDMQVVATIVFLSTVLFPLLELCALLYALIPMHAGYRPRGFDHVLRAIQALRPWGMLEVLMLGILVTLVKMSSIARVIPEAALFAFGALTFLVAAILTFDPRNLWDLGERLQRRPVRSPREAPPGRPAARRART
jgi:paraquat-inducible protein A